MNLDQDKQQNIFAFFSVNIKHVDVVLGILFHLTRECVRSNVNFCVFEIRSAASVAEVSSVASVILIASRTNMCKVKEKMFSFYFSYYYSFDNWMRWKVFWGAFNLTDFEQSNFKKTEIKWTHFQFTSKTWPNKLNVKLN